MYDAVLFLIEHPPGRSNRFTYALLDGRTFPLFAAILIALSLWGHAVSLGHRTPFTIPLANLSYSDAREGSEEKVSIWFEKANELWEVYPTLERHITDQAMNGEEETYRKSPGQEFILSPIEAQLLSRVCKTLIKTLEGFDHDLKNNRWDKCLYLDSYLASFCRGFYHLVEITRSSRQALPAITFIADSLYDRSPESPKSDKRIAQWRQTPDYIIKLRIATKELIFQIKQWQIRELDNSKRDPWVNQSGDFVLAYEFFIRLYFNLPPQ